MGGVKMLKEVRADRRILNCLWECGDEAEQSKHRRENHGLCAVMGMGRSSGEATVRTCSQCKNQRGQNMP